MSMEGLEKFFFIPDWSTDFSILELWSTRPRASEIGALVSDCAYGEIIASGKLKDISYKGIELSLLVRRQRRCRRWEEDIEDAQRVDVDVYPTGIHGSTAHYV
jgi:hypothetical protein